MSIKSIGKASGDRNQDATSSITSRLKFAKKSYEKKGEYEVEQWKNYPVPKADT